MPAWWKASCGPAYCYTCDTPNTQRKRGPQPPTKCLFCGGSAFYRDRERASREAGRNYYKETAGRKGKTALINRVLEERTYVPSVVAPPVGAYRWFRARMRSRTFPAGTPRSPLEALTWEEQLT